MELAYKYNSIGFTVSKLSNKLFPISNVPGYVWTVDIADKYWNVLNIL